MTKVSGTCTIGARGGNPVPTPVAAPVAAPVKVPVKVPAPTPADDDDYGYYYYDDYNYIDCSSGYVNWNKKKRYKKNDLVKEKTHAYKALKNSKNKSPWKFSEGNKKVWTWLGACA